MRFAAAPSPSEERPSAAEPVRSRAKDDSSCAEAQAEAKKTMEPPLDLDQRVRLVGEW